MSGIFSCRRVLRACRGDGRGAGPRHRGQRRQPRGPGLREHHLCPTIRERRSLGSLSLFAVGVTCCYILCSGAMGHTRGRGGQSGRVAPAGAERQSSAPAGYCRHRDAGAGAGVSRRSPESRDPRHAGQGGRVLKEKLQSKEARLGVIGLGYVGLPLSMEFASAGFHVTGIDTDARKVRDAGERASPTSRTCRANGSGRRVDAGRFEADDRLRGSADLDAVDICVPDAAQEDQGPGHLVRAGRGGRDRASTSTRSMLVILDSTTYPGTTDEVILSRLETHRTQGRRGLLPRVLAGARRPGQRAVEHARTSPRSSAA